MRIFALGITVLWGCATATPGADPNIAGSTRSSTASISSQVDPTTRTIEVQAGTVQLRHTIPSGARLRATTLEGLDDANRHLQYEWTADGAYTVAVSGRYRHSVSGSIAGQGRLTSVLEYRPRADTTQSSMTEILRGLMAGQADGVTGWGNADSGGNPVEVIHVRIGGSGKRPPPEHAVVRELPRGRHG